MAYLLQTEAGGVVKSTAEEPKYLPQNLSPFASPKVVPIAAIAAVVPPGIYALKDKIYIIMLQWTMFTYLATTLYLRAKLS